MKNRLGIHNVTTKICLNVNLISLGRLFEVIDCQGGIFLDVCQQLVGGRAKDEMPSRPQSRIKDGDHFTWGEEDMLQDIIANNKVKRLVFEIRKIVLNVQKRFAVIKRIHVIKFFSEQPC
jgi:hypothetical protein